MCLHDSWYTHESYFVVEPSEVQQWLCHKCRRVQLIGN